LDLSLNCLSDNIRVSDVCPGHPYQVRLSQTDDLVSFFKCSHAPGHDSGNSTNGSDGSACRHFITCWFMHAANHFWEGMVTTQRHVNKIHKSSSLDRFNDTNILVNVDAANSSI